jgi:protoporphyrinogen oxidase
MAGRWVHFPLEAADLVRSLPPGLAARAAVDAVVSPLRRPRADTYAEEVRAGLGPAITGAFHEPYARKLWGLPADELDGELARRRIAVRSPSAVLAKLRPSAPRTFWYPGRGFGAIVESLDGAARGAGAEVFTETEVRRLHAIRNGVRATLDDDTEVEAATVLSTVPVPVLARLLDPAPGRDALEASAAMRYRGMAFVYLVVDRDRYSEFDAHYLPGPSTIVSRLSEPKGYRDGPDPTGRTVLCAEVPCWADLVDPLWVFDDEELATRVCSELTALGVPPIRPVASTVLRVPRVYPVYERGTAQRLASVEEAVSAVPGLVTCGRGGLYTADNTHHVLAMARDAVSCLRPGGGFDDERWAFHRERHRTNVVED